MRPIKLRAWYKDVMWYDVGVFEEGVYAWSDGDLCPLILHDKEDEEKLGLPIVTQFTGMFDKNGKEIWEGDICIGLFNAELDYSTVKFEVVFDGCAFRDSYFYYVLESPKNKLEVIGNIFENLNWLRR